MLTFLILSLVVNVVTIPLQSQAFAAYYVMEYESQKVISKHHETITYQPGNLTQMMTLVIVYESIASHQIQLTDKVLIDKDITSIKDHQLPLVVGDCVTIKDLIKYVLHLGAYDATLALVKYVSGSEEAFVSKMNDKVKQLKLEHTHFHNPYGYHDVLHYSCAKDLATILHYLLKIGENSFIALSKDSECLVSSNQEIWMASENVSLKQFEGCDVIKMSEHLNHQYSIASSAKEKGVRSIAIGLYANHINQANEEMISFFQQTFHQYKTITLVSKNEFQDKIDVYQGDLSTVSFYHPPLQCSVLVDDNVTVTSAIIHHQKLYAPIQKDQKIGVLKVTLSNHKCYELPLYAKTSVSKQSLLTLFLKNLWHSIS